MNKILIFATGYLPGKNYGGPVTSISNFVNLCGDELDIYIVTTNHDFKDTKVYDDIKPGWNKVGNAKVLYLSDAHFTYKRLKNLVGEIRPNLIYQNSFFNPKLSIPLLFLAKFNKEKLFVAPRGELLPNALEQKFIKKSLFITFIKMLNLIKNVSFQATTNEERDKIIEVLGIDSDRVITLGNLPSLPRYQENKQKKEAGKLRLVFIARIHPIKNLHFAIECLKGIKGNVSFNIYGSKEIQDYWGQCLQSISELQQNIIVNYCGIAARDEVHHIFSSHDAMLLPTLTENYGHSIVEAMLSNCPVVISNNTPWTDINSFGAGWAISLEKPNEYKKVLQELVNMPNDEYQELLVKNKKYIQNKLKIEELKNQYINTFTQIL
ncbi:glycosyltransferase family 4 protein [Neobacillus drentensis]|uniref:glycosyltransferase family 4 protein n=1 Tax=Neobacillus drentensis TaxID=220684 RepID=UPI003000FE59